MQFIKTENLYVLITNQNEDPILNIFRNSCLKNPYMNGTTHSILLNRIFNKFTFPQYLEML